MIIPAVIQYFSKPLTLIIKACNRELLGRHALQNMRSKHLRHHRILYVISERTNKERLV